MTKTPIEWADFTVNPFRFRNLKTGKVGHHCTKISPGCKNCYSGKMQTGPYLSGLAFIEENKPKGEFFLDEGALEQVLRRKKPAKIFWCDMTDMFLEDYPDEWIVRCVAVMALTPWHTHQVLTKRAERMREFFASDLNQAATHMAEDATLHRMVGGATMGTPWPLPNVWLGVSAENQEFADKRIPHLLRTPAAIRFVSYEPALGPVSFRSFIGHHVTHGACVKCGIYHPATKINGCVYQSLDEPLDWIIVGGESGPSARPFDTAWARQTVAQCKEAAVPVFVKQLGANPWDSASGKDVDHLFVPCGHACDCCDECPSNEGQRPRGDHPRPMSLDDRKGGDMAEWPAGLRVREFPEVRQ